MHWLASYKIYWAVWPADLIPSLRIPVYYGNIVGRNEHFPGRSGYKNWNVSLRMFTENPPTPADFLISILTIHHISKGNQYNIRTVFKLKTLYNAHLWERDQKGSLNRRQSVSILFPVNVAEAPSVKQADRWPCESMKTRKISSTAF
jgi:hypothetical protein